eukprot:359959-Chlamydomonas_euryale.AAC.1
MAADTGLAGGGGVADGAVDRVQQHATVQVCRLVAFLRACGEPCSAVAAAARSANPHLAGAPLWLQRRVQHARTVFCLPSHTHSLLFTLDFPEAITSVCKAA